MRTKILVLLIVTAILSSNALWAATPAKKSKSSAVKKSTKHHKKVKAKKGSWKNRGQKQIADDRTREIQSALVREGYLEGEPTGVMDDRTKSALAKLQAENGWQTKIVPDSRALIKLGLGPDQSKIINPSSAALAAPISGATGIAETQQ